MTEHSFHFRGIFDIYLQGMDALQPIRTSTDYISYYVGNPASKILVQDYRSASARAAQLALQGFDIEKFADVFSMPGLVEIRASLDDAEIVIRDLPRKFEPIQILWLGLLYDEDFEEYELQWRLIKPITASITAFAALVN